MVLLKFAWIRFLFLFFYFLLNTGARINEARSVKVAHTDLKYHRLTLVNTKRRTTKNKKTGEIKTNPSIPRPLTISTQFAKYLEKHIKKNNLKRTDTLRILSTPADNIAMKKALQKAEFGDWQQFSVHNIRKTLECWLLSLDVDELRLRLHFGHTINTAQGHYLSPDVFTREERQIIKQIIGDLYQNSY